jgi:TolA-binding protein
MKREFHTEHLDRATAAARRAGSSLSASWRLRAGLVSVALVAGAWAASHPTALVDWAARPRGAPRPEPGAEPLETLVSRVEAASAAERHAEVALLCEKIVAGYADHPVVEPARVRLVQAYMECGDPRAAERALVELRRNHPDSPLLPEVLLHVATWQYDRHEYVAAAQTWTDLIAVVTRNRVRTANEDTAPQPVIVRSLSLWKKLQREERSRTEMERLARFNQALCWERAAEGEAALRAYDRFVSRFPQDEHAPEARYRIASLLLQRGLVQEALDYYLHVASDPTAQPEFRCESVYRAGRCQESLRRLDAAVTTYAQALTLVPAEHPMRLAALAQLAQHVEQREPLRALAIYRELATCSSDAAVRAVALQRLSVLEGESSALSTRR